jgi:hypothetical protein
MTKGKVQITTIIQNVLNDTDLEHLTVRDLRNVVLHLQTVLMSEDEEEEGEVDLTRYVL